LTYIYLGQNEKERPEDEMSWFMAVEDVELYCRSAFLSL